jgi:peptidoglycan/LPS O-acetylase OafA/YrhL
LASLILVSVAGPGPLSFLCPPTFVMTIFIFAHEGGFISSFLKWRPLTFLGALSYSIYMTHLFVQARLLNLIGAVSSYVTLPISVEYSGSQTISSTRAALATDVTIIIMLLIVLACAHLTFKFIEEPLRKWSRGISALETR